MDQEFQDLMGDVWEDPDLENDLELFLEYDKKKQRQQHGMTPQLQSLFASANTAYVEQDYSQALLLFRQIIKQLPSAHKVFLSC